MTADHRPNHDKSPTSRSTIGLLLAHIEGKLSCSVWQGVTDVARERDVNVICFMPRSHRPISTVDLNAQTGLLFDLVSTDRVDGLIVWTAPIRDDIGAAGVQAIFDRYRSLPAVAIEEAPAGIPRVVVDNYRAMREAIVHLIEVHKYRRIAFIRGPDLIHVGAHRRYQAYLDVLTEYGLPVDPDLVSPPAEGKEMWETVVGEAGISLFLDQRHVDFDAVVTANDVFAQGAVDALQARGIHVPQQVAVIGFDNVDYGRWLTPPLTTVSLQTYEQGRQAAETLLTLLEGGKVPEQVDVPLKLIIRQSCGCVNPAVAQAAAGPVRLTGELSEGTIDAQRHKILAEMRQAINTADAGLNSDWAGRLLAAFLTELVEDEATGTFLPTLDTILRQVTAVDGQISEWQNVISTLRRCVLPHLGLEEALQRAEDLWLQAQVMIGEIAQRAQGHQAWQTEEQTRLLNRIETALITTFDVEGLARVLTRELPRLGIPGCYLSLYEDPQRPIEQSRLILAYDKRGILAAEAGTEVFPSPWLVPAGLLPQGRPYSYVVEPLYFHEEQLGFVVLEQGLRQGAIYDMLRELISSALKSALLSREREKAEAALKQAYAEVEQQVEERTAELRKETAEREQAQAESLHLQQEVIEAQKQALMELSTPVIPVMEGIIVVPLIGAIDTMRARDITRALLVGIQKYHAKIVILDITGVPIVDSNVASHLNKTIQAAQLKGTRTIVTGISEAVAETVVDLGIDWSSIETLADMQTGLRSALTAMGLRIKR
jgi:DNA-binding LacI/PurR family transcriptional regulator/anti-anti-sigma regulatory factor